jgi:F0F1-type ATP synthase assembly protein I
VLNLVFFKFASQHPISKKVDVLAAILRGGKAWAIPACFSCLKIVWTQVDRAQRLLSITVGEGKIIPVRFNCFLCLKIYTSFSSYKFARLIVFLVLVCIMCVKTGA